ncbi:DUF58 domain-containing protein [Paenibacillus faecis]|uniref:DUF58 domain-containing protein n=1 Tax=Paenibacillus faecis TaxID=862114 RepID=A0A5D0CNT8_9BACL|nr:DUF58 domain-containing protein [Paenibacillus faecis]TYA11719.1 DUF58 domain-containing protein [Paenibacillus faecis]
MNKGFGIWILMALTAGFLGAFYGWRGGTSLLFLLLLILLVALQGAAAQWLGPRQVHVVRSYHPRHPRAGEPVEVTVRVSLDGGSPPLWIRADDEWRHSGEGAEPPGEELPGGKLVFGGWRKEWTGTYDLKPVKRGVYRAEGMRITWGDSFGWFKRTFRADADDVLIVHPAPLTALSGGPGLFDPDAEGAGSGRAPELPSGSDLGRLRSYAPGDPLRHVHWKSSAKKGALLTRVPEEPVTPSRCLLLDTSPEAYPAGGGGADADGFELAVSAAAAWLERELARSDEVDFRQGDAAAREGRVAWKSLSGRHGLKEGLDQLAGAALVSSLSGPDLLQRAWPLARSRSMTFITGSLTAELTEAALLLTERGAALEIWCADLRDRDPEAARHAARLREKGLRLIDLSRYRGGLPGLAEGGASHVIA